VGIVHHGRLISLGDPLQLRRKLGLITVETKDNGRTHYSYFPDRDAASKFIHRLNSSEKVIMRESNLEDVFVELTGQKVQED